MSLRGTGAEDGRIKMAHSEGQSCEDSWGEGGGTAVRALSVVELWVLWVQHPVMYVGIQAGYVEDVHLLV